MRERYVDHAKAFAIILVAAGHIAVLLRENNYDFFGALSYYIYCFHMPFFFVLSGLSCRLGQKRHRADKNAYIYIYMRIIIRCADFGWTILLFNALAFLIFPERLSFAYNSGGILGVLLTCAERYWYLVALSLIELVIPLLKKLDNYALPILLGASLLCGCVHMGAAKFILYLFFFSLGMYCNDHPVRMRTGWICGLVFALCSTAWYFISGGGELIDVYTKAVMGTSGSLFFLCLFKCGCRNGKGTVFAAIGRNTLIIYLTHACVLELAWEYQIFPFSAAPMCAFVLLSLLLCIVSGLLILLLERFPRVKMFLLSPSKLLAGTNAGRKLGM